MTSTERADPETSGRAMDELYVEFDGQQVTFATDVPEMRDYLARTLPMDARGAETAATSGVSRPACRPAWVFLRCVARRSSTTKERFLLSTSSSSMSCLVQFIRERQDLPLWLHAAAVERNGKALLVAGPSGQGKSTLSTRLCEKGWNFMSDDIAPVRMSSNDATVSTSSVSADRRGPDPESGGARGSRKRTGQSCSRVHSSRRRSNNSDCVSRLSPRRLDDTDSDGTAGNAAFELLRSYTNFVDHKVSE